MSTEVDFEKIQMNIEVLSKGMELYNQLRKKYDGLTKLQEKKMDTIISSIIKLDDLSEEHLRFESNLMNEIRKNNPEIFDQINTPYNYQIESTLKLIILKYNQAIENGIRLQDFFKSVEQKTSVSNNASAFNKIALGIVQNGRARKMTPRECARLQGFPDTYKLLDNDNAVYKQMGNAVSVPVIAAVVTDLIENNDIFNKTKANTSKSHTLASRTIPTLDQNCKRAFTFPTQKKNCF